MTRDDKNKRIYWLIIFIIFISGCATTRIRHAVPVGLAESAQIIGRQDIRLFEGGTNTFIADGLIKSLEQETNEVYFKGSEGKKIYSAIAISGGAANGAYGAGLLKGWSQSGTRPVFKIVTGISTGAIMAPLVFLGSRYDDKLEKFYTTYSTKDIMRKKGLLGIFFGNSFTDNQPLKRLIGEYLDKHMLEEISREYHKGRRLYIGTTSLDHQKLVIWDMGKIASIADDKALELFRKVILASASIPAAFPPVYFDVEVNGVIYDEMHVDGGITRQVFFLYGILQSFEDAAKTRNIDTSKIGYRIYIIRNGYMNGPWQEVPDKLPDIAKRAVDTIVTAQGLGDIYQLYVFTKKKGGDFNLAYIPEDYVSNSKELFDPVEMKKLFDLGFEEAVGGYHWKKTLSDFQ